MRTQAKNAEAHPKILRLDHRSALPLHAQAEEVLRKLIKRPVYQTGGFLPDEVSMSRNLGISRSTLRMAIARLVSEGVLERKSGVGTRVVEKRVESGVGAWHSFTREMEAKGITVETYSTRVRVVPATTAEARALQMPVGSEVLCLDRIRGWDAQPEVAFRSFFHPRIGLTTEEDWHKPLYEMIRDRCNVVVDQSHEEFLAVSADRALSLVLGVPLNAPLLRRERTVLDTGRRPVEFAVVHYRCERFRLALKLSEK